MPIVAACVAVPVTGEHMHVQNLDGTSTQWVTLVLPDFITIWSPNSSGTSYEGAWKQVLQSYIEHLSNDLPKNFHEVRHARRSHLT